MKTFLITLFVGATTLLPIFAQDAVPATDGTTPEIGAVLKETLLDLTGSVKLMKIIEFNYVPSQRDPFISHEIISPFVTEEEIPEIEPDKQQNKITKSEIESLVKSRVRINGVSTGNAGGGYAIANLTGKAVAGLTKKTEVILKPGSTLAIPLTEDEATMIGGRLAEMAGITLAMNPGRTSILLVTQRVNERFLPPGSPAGMEATPVVVFKNPVSIQGEPDSELYVPYKKDWGLEAE